MSDQPAESMEALAKRFIDALETADVDALKAMYASDATLWMNTTQRVLAAAEILPFLPRLSKRMPDRTYGQRRVTPFDGGFVHRHRLTGTRSDGARVAAECCAIVFVEEGKVVRVEEYVDGRQLEALSG